VALIPFLIGAAGHFPRRTRRPKAYACGDKVASDFVVFSTTACKARENMAEHPGSIGLYLEQPGG